MRPARLVTVTATDGLMLPGLFFEPDKASKRAAIWLHGMGSSGSFYPVTHTNALARELTDSGIAFLALNNRGAGNLQGVKYLTDNGDKLKRIQGTTHELIAECVFDVDGALEFARSEGYSEFFLLGHSTGANKVVLYNYLKPNSIFAGYVVYGGGDDTGLFYEQLGPAGYKKALLAAKSKIRAGQGESLAPVDLVGDYFSYQSLLDILDPDGGYNTFPYFEYQSGIRLGRKELFREFKSIHRPTLVVYGEQDEYCKPSAAACEKILGTVATDSKCFTFKLIAGGDHSCYRHEDELARVVAGWAASVTI